MGKNVETNKEEKQSQNAQPDKEVIYNVTDSNRQSIGPKKVTFKSLHRGTLVFVTPDKYLRFVNHLLQTDDEETIAFLRNHPAFGQEIFEGEFPEWVREKFKKDKQFLNYFNPEDETIIG